MKHIALFTLIATFLACGESPSSVEDNFQHQSTAYSDFDDFKESFVEALWKIEPIWASYAGYHAYDSLLPIPNEANRANKIAFIEHWLSELNTFDVEKLDLLNQVDHRMIKDALLSNKFNIERFKAYAWNPAVYNLGGAFFQVLNYRGKDLDWRITQLSKKLEQIPAYYEAAKQQLASPSRIHTELALKQLQGSLSIFQRDLIDSLAVSSHNRGFQKDFKAKVKTATHAIEGFVEYLEMEILPQIPKDDESFRIGKELFEEKFSHTLHSAYTAEEIFKAAVQAKSDLHDKMLQLSEMLWEDYFGDEEMPGNRLDRIQKVIDEVSKTHAHRDSFLFEIQKQIPQLEAFVKAHDLLTLDEEKPLKVREAPQYMRGVAVASISAPGPYDPDAETYYNVTPLEDYTDEEAESYLREYNRYVMQILNIHEAVPGHYTQLVYSNKSPSIIKSIFGNGAMIEGWAVYSERMMLENNYGGSAKEMGLMYYKWNLRTVCNAILDYGVHVHGFTKEEAMQLLQREAFQEEAEAEGKWIRAQLSQVQLSSYYTGFYEIMQLRDKMRELKAEDFSLKDFHETFLSYGSAPVKYISEMMLENGELKKE